MNNQGESREQYFRSIENLPPEELFNILKNVPTTELFLEVCFYSITLLDFIYSRMEFRRAILINEFIDLPQVRRVLSIMGPELQHLAIFERRHDVRDILDYAFYHNPNVSSLQMHNITNWCAEEKVLTDACFSVWTNLRYVDITDGVGARRCAEVAHEN